MGAKKHHLLNNAVFFFFALFAFSSSFSIALSQASFGISLLLFIILAVATRYNPFACRLLCIYSVIGLYLVWMIVSTLVNDSSLWNLKEEWLFSIIPVGLFLFKQQKFRRIIVVSLALGVILASTYGVIQHYTGVNWFKEYLPTPAHDGTFYALGGFHHNLTYGNYLAVAAMFVISLGILKKTRPLSSFNWLVHSAGIMGFMGTILSYSRMAVATLPFGFFALMWLKGRRWVLTSSALLIVTVLLTFLLVDTLAFKYRLALEEDLAGPRQTSRLFIWKISVAIIKDHPLFGVGQGNFEKVYMRYLDPTKNETRTRPHAHNDFLNYAAIAGIPGALIFISLWILVFYRLHQIWHDSEAGTDMKIFAGAAAIGGLAFLLTSLTEATFADEEVRQLLMVVWAAGLWPFLSKNGPEERKDFESA